MKKIKIGIFGVGRGMDLAKDFLLLGADVVAIGRPVIYGLALGGWRGVESLINYLKSDLQRVMWLAGAQTVADIKDATLRPHCLSVRCQNY